MQLSQSVDATITISPMLSSGSYDNQHARKISLVKEEGNLKYSILPGSNGNLRITHEVYYDISSFGGTAKDTAPRRNHI